MAHHLGKIWKTMRVRNAARQWIKIPVRLRIENGRAVFSAQLSNATTPLTAGSEREIENLVRAAALEPTAVPVEAACVELTIELDKHHWERRRPLGNLSLTATALELFEGEERRTHRQLGFQRVYTGWPDDANEPYDPDADEVYYACLLPGCLEEPSVEALRRFSHQVGDMVHRVLRCSTTQPELRQRCEEAAGLLRQICPAVQPPTKKPKKKA